MPINSIAKLKLTPEKETAYREWLAARDKYKAESALFQRTRRQLPKEATHCSYEQLLLLTASKERYSAACKEYYAAQCAWNAVNSPMSSIDFKSSSATEQIQDAVNLLMQSFNQTKAPTAIEIDTEADKARFGLVENNFNLSTIAMSAKRYMLDKSTSETDKQAEMLGTTEKIEVESLCRHGIPMSMVCADCEKDAAVLDEEGEA